MDVAARLFAERLAERWKQPVVIENRPGADGLLGTAKMDTRFRHAAVLMDLAVKTIEQRLQIPAEIETAGPVGDRIRARIGKEAYDLNLPHYCCGGLNFGYFYDASPIIAYDGHAHPTYTMYDFTPSSVPGCRAPHLWLRDGVSLYDALGPEYTLLRIDPTVRISGLVAAAALRRVPLTVLDIGESDARALYACNLVLVRPDQHIAWRGDVEPLVPLDIIDLLCGKHVHLDRKVA